jgi:iron complex outermembrane receptor protein
MSELNNVQNGQVDFRQRLLTTASVLALLVVTYAADSAQASDQDADKPLVWIELGGQLSRLDDGQEAFSPHLMAGRPAVFDPSQKFERPPLYSLDEYGKFSFQPEASSWVISAAVLYGRSSSAMHVHQQTHPTTPVVTVGTSAIRFPPIAERFSDTNAQNDEHHLIADFQVGRDVGLGMFGGTNGSSIVGLGVRFAQFSAKSNIMLKSDPDWHRSPKYFAGYKFPKYEVYHSNAASLTADRSFHGIGPALSWNASAPLAGDANGAQIALDFGVNAAVLFGRQKVAIHHHVTGEYKAKGNSYRHVTSQPTPVNLTRARTMTVPNVGGFAGLSFQYAVAKISFGYRADLFFNAMDGGIGTRKLENTGFYGPFARVSVGLGG